MECKSSVEYFFPDRLENAIIIASTARLTAQNIAFNEIARRAIITDKSFHGGDYYSEYFS